MKEKVKELTIEDVIAEATQSVKQDKLKIASARVKEILKRIEQSKEITRGLEREKELLIMELTTSIEG